MHADYQLPLTTPEQQGMDSAKLKAAFQLLEQEINKDEIPGGVALVGRNGAIVGTCAVGRAVATPELELPVTEDTIYDCASLTKVMVTLPLILQLVDRGELRLKDPVTRYFPEFAANDKSDVTIMHLLTHTSGFQAFRNLHSHGWTPGQIRAAVMEEGLVYPCGGGYEYSDFNYIVLGEIAAKLFGLPLQEAAQKFILEPLGMSNSGYRPDTALQPRIAATEFMQGSCRWGEVHDENALAMGGVSGHAGLFATAGDAAKYAVMWLNKGKLADGSSLLSAAAVEGATRSYTQGKENANRGLGWVLKGDKWDASGDWFSAQSFGHTGFTGTSLWMDPTANVFAVLLTNRVHYGREKSVVRLRDCFHNAVAASIRL